MGLNMTELELAAFKAAIIAGKLKLVRSSVNENIDFLTQPLDKGDHFCALHVATRSNNLPIVQFILETKPELLEQVDAYNQTPLLWAAAKGFTPILRYLIDLGANFNVTTSRPDDIRVHGLSPLKWATKGGHTSCIRLLAGVASSHTDMQSYFQNHPDALNLLNDDFKNYLSGVIDRADLSILTYLADQTANFEKLSSDEQFQLIKFATKPHQLDVVMFLLRRNPDLVNMLDSEGNTLMHWVLEQQHDDIKIQLLSTMIKNGDSEKILPFIQTGRDAIHLMALHSEIRDYLVADTRIMQLIHDEPYIQNIQSAPGTLHYYYSPPLEAPATRRSSFSCEINTVNKRCSFFTSTKELGRGSYGLVRKFTNQMGEHRAVKSNLSPFVGAIKIQEWKKNTIKEADIMSVMYPDKVYHLSHLECNDGRVETYNYRFQMPYIKGKSLLDILIKTNCKRKQAELILKLAQEVYRIHQQGYIHGDLKFANILVNVQGVIYCIDWGCASKLGQPAIVFEGAYKYGYAPERFTPISKPTESKPPASQLLSHPSQDIYSLGFLLGKILQLCGPMPLFPSINIFITEALRIDPTKRPDLGEFCVKLNSEVNGEDLIASSSASCSFS